MYTRPLTAVTALLLSCTASAQTTSEDELFLEEISIVGSQEDVLIFTGAAHVISREDLEQFEYSDIQRMIRKIPGISVQVEDGYGLRPNLSIRGVATERSGRITLLEDNVLIAPAPYSAPSAYYFPTAGRMSAIEVLKGPAAIGQGPYTIGGAVNLLSTPVPSSAARSLMLEYGENNTYRLHGIVGSSLENGFGYLLETHQWYSDGFQEVDRGGNSGLDVRDYTVKLAYAPDRSPHRVELKLQFADQESNQSYLGLTDRHFRQAALRRYGLSTLDRIATDHDQAILRYTYSPTNRLSLSFTAYNNEHARNWFKTEGLDFDGSDSAAEIAAKSWSSIIGAINLNQRFLGLTPADLSAVLDGSRNTEPGSILIRANNRSYFSRGFEVQGEWITDWGPASHTLEAGLRIHEDQEDRLQRNSSYSQVMGALQLDDPGAWGNAGNRIQRADALAIYLRDRIEFGRFTISPGIRYEDIEQSRVRYETRRNRTNDPSSRAESNLRDTRENLTTVLLPGVGLLYRLNEDTVLLGGVHKGFTAPSNAEGVREESALNWEFGVRSFRDNFRIEAVAFLSDYDNLLGECTASSGAECEIGDAFNGDAATVRGLEFVASTGFSIAGGLHVPATFAFTYIDGTFDSDVADTRFFGDVSAGDPLPYIPEHQWQALTGLESRLWALHLSANYVAEVCVRSSCGEFERTEASLTLDLAAHVVMGDSTRLFGRIENLTDDTWMMSRHPYGARPNKSRTLSFGINLDF
ncbi:MAG: TonB-dependent receptor [Rhodospirillaceae bacterium]|nr:TonB-dependent receptor [Rhodospirillaceae bacterium]